MGSITWQYAALGALAVVWLLLLNRRLGLRFRRRHGRERQSPVWASIVGWLLIAALVAAAAGGGLLWLLGWPTMPKQAAFSTTEMLDLLKIGLAVVAGFGGVVALAVNYRKQRVTEAAHAHALNQEERERTKLFTERFKDAAELLSGEQPGLRIAGVAAMAGLADDWEVQQQMCVDALIDQLRLREDDSQTTNKILRALRDRLGSHREAGPWSALNFDFTGIRFVDADFSERTFAGAVVFDGAEFTGDNTSFERTAFKDTKLSCHGTTFTHTTVNFQDTHFGYGAIEFVGCSFDHATFDMRGMHVFGRGVDFYRCDFTKSNFSGQDLTLSTVFRVELCTLIDSDIDVRRFLYHNLRAVRFTNNTVISSLEGP
ncbi:pentapeptide repeat-containing protein [Lentzea sp. NPDC058450]|uniref:pentapeptide repeat-containing protein n=1 Tax=Lentzea sp. NPDC058450 TaxID=3346505 RepID=UPI003668BDA5